MPRRKPTPTPLPPSPTPGAFVKANGTQLTLNAVPYRFAGVNLYNANSRNNCWFPLGYNDSALATALAYIPGADVFRAWFFQWMATSNGVRDWTAFDHTLSVAAAAGKKVIVTLADQWGACERPDISVYKSEAWYSNGYTTSPDNPYVLSSYRTWVTEAVTRYRDDPTILMWQLMNEAEDAPAANTGCTSSAAATLYAWASDMASVVKHIDSNHLLNIGTSGGGQCGAVYRDYQTLYSIPAVDICEYHDYGSPTDSMPGDQWNGLQFRIDQCAALGKPIFVGEVGIKTTDAGSLSTRASDFNAKLAAWYSAGVSGALLWNFVPPHDSAYGGGSDYDLLPGDPALALLGQY